MLRSAGHVDRTIPPLVVLHSVPTVGTDSGCKEQINITEWRLRNYYANTACKAWVRVKRGLCLRSGLVTADLQRVLAPLGSAETMSRALS